MRDVLILPGVGHFGQLMRTLEKRESAQAAGRRHCARANRFWEFAWACRRFLSGARRLPARRGWAFSRGTCRRCRLRPSCRTWDGTNCGGCVIRCCWRACPTDAYFYFAHSYAAMDAGGRRGDVRSRGAVCGGAGVFGTCSRCNFIRRSRATPERACWRILWPTRRPRRDHDAGPANHSLPGYGRRARREGRELREFARCGRSRRRWRRATTTKARTSSWCWISRRRAITATFLETIRRVAAELAIPLTAGGGVSTVDDGRAILRAGADKLTVNTAALRNPAAADGSGGGVWFAGGGAGD